MSGDRIGFSTAWSSFLKTVEASRESFNDETRKRKFDYEIVAQLQLFVEENTRSSELFYSEMDRALRRLGGGI